MKYSPFFLIILCVLIGIGFFSYLQVHRTSSTILLSPLISDTPNTIPEVSSEEATPSAAFLIKCVLTYGTFEISQEDCDFLLAQEATENPHKESVQCIISAGTFLVSEKECSILRAAHNYEDVMQRIDE